MVEVFWRGLMWRKLRTFWSLDGDFLLRKDTAVVEGPESERSEDLSCSWRIISTRVIRGWTVEFHLCFHWSFLLWHECNNNNTNNINRHNDKTKRVNEVPPIGLTIIRRKVFVPPTSAAYRKHLLSSQNQFFVAAYFRGFLIGAQIRSAAFCGVALWLCVLHSVYQQVFEVKSNWTKMPILFRK